jgi:cation diffusion facilitator family transporter
MIDAAGRARNHGEVPATRSSDARALVISTWTSAGFAVLALGWGLATGSRLIVFDGLYSFASVGLSLLAVLALRTAGKGADERYPWGREAWEPLTVVVKAIALGGLTAYALIGAVGDLLRGGRDVDAGWAVAYGIVAALAGLGVTVFLRRRSRLGGSDLVRAEAAEWTGDTVLSTAVLVGFVVALVLDRTGRSELARYVDPVMLALVSAAFLWVPAKLVAGGLREVLTMSAPEHLQSPIDTIVREVQDIYGFAESFVRTSKVGSRLDVEIDFVVDDRSRPQTVRELDAVRADLERRLTALHPAPSMWIGFTADRRWAH